MQQEWYFKINNIEVGPLDSQAFFAYAKEGRVTPGTQVKLGENGEWTVAKNVDGLFADEVPAKTPEPTPETSKKLKPILKGPASQPQTQAPAVTTNPEPSKPDDTPSPYESTPNTFTYTTSVREMQGEPMVCPHCWGKFPEEHIHYISQHMDLIGDPLLGDGKTEQIRFLPDRFTPEGHAIDARGMICPDMACPYCHLRIPQTIIDLNSIFYSIIGAPQSGKSYFLTSMVWSLRNKLSSLFNFSFSDADPHANAKLNSYEQQLYLNPKPEEVTIIEKTQIHGDLYSHVKLNNMDVELPVPFIFKLQPFDEALDEETYTRNLILYDNAGEHFQPGREEVSQPATKHLIYSNGLIFLFDPAIDAKMRLKCNPDDPVMEVLKSKITNQETLLAEMIRRIRLYSGMKTTEKYQHPLVVVVSKYDLWENLLPDDLKKVEPWIHDDEDFAYKFDLDTLLNVSYHMRSILNKMSPSLVKTAESFSSRVFFVPASTFGCSSEENKDSGGIGVRPELLDSVWTEVPILLLLAEHGYIPLAPREQQGEQVTNFKLKKDSIIFTVPGTNERVQLPAVYFGASLQNAENGEWFSLPGAFDLEEKEEEQEIDDDDFWAADSVIKTRKEISKPKEKPQDKPKPEEKTQPKQGKLKPKLKPKLKEKPAEESQDKTMKPKGTKLEKKDSPNQAKSGMELGDFTLVETLGRGSMGQVWSAQQESMGRKVAVKILSPELTEDQKFVDRFLKEAKTSAKLSHPNIVTAFASGFDQGFYYLAISYVDGETIEDTLTLDGVYEEKTALKLIKGIVSALDYAWNEAKILHRDIKPANIIVTKKGVPMILDMGISKSVDEDSSLTMTGMIIGTPYYISPEQALSEKDIDFRSDIYSLGVTLYHMITGSVPYNATTAVAIMMKHVKADFPPPEERNPDVSKEFSELLKKMMAKERDERPSSWKELDKMIDLVIEGKPISSTS